jgi:hypothetical protein
MRRNPIDAIIMLSYKLVTLPAVVGILVKKLSYLEEIWKNHAVHFKRFHVKIAYHGANKEENSASKTHADGRSFLIFVWL